MTNTPNDLIKYLSFNYIYSVSAFREDIDHIKKKHKEWFLQSNNECIYGDKCKILSEIPKARRMKPGAFTIDHHEWVQVLFVTHRALYHTKFCLFE